MTRMALLATLLLSSSCFGFSGDAPYAESLRIDHVIVGVADFDRGMDQFEQLTGVRPVIGDGWSPRASPKSRFATSGSSATESRTRYQDRG